MKTEVIPVESAGAAGIVKAGQLLAAGQLVAFPTETGQTAWTDMLWSRFSRQRVAPRITP